MQDSDQVLSSGSKTKSKQQAAMLWNSLKPFFVRTEPADLELQMRKNSFKTPTFRSIFLPRAQPTELVVLGQFLDQGEYAEEILCEVYS
jgi:hypothetical protein